MAKLGPFAPDRRVVVGVSGGADSMALAWLLRAWGSPLAVVVDHGLRTESGAEAVLTQARLAAMGVPARIVRLTGLERGAGLGARARAARYAALLGVCAAEGLPDLLIAHHAQDQAETVALRARAGSGPAGLAGMAAVSWRDEARILRPLLPVPPERLRATLREAGLAWVEDPTNHDPATARGGLRASGLKAGPLLADAARQGVARRTAEFALAEELARGVRILPAGYAEVAGGLSAAGWSAVVWTISGRVYPPPVPGVGRLAAAGQGTLHGVEVYASRLPPSLGQGGAGGGSDRPGGNKSNPAPGTRPGVPACGSNPPQPPPWLSATAFTHLVRTKEFPPPWAREGTGVGSKNPGKTRRRPQTQIQNLDQQPTPTPPWKGGGSIAYDPATRCVNPVGLRERGSALAVREAVAMAPAVPATAGAVWDGRFLLADDVPGAVLGAWGNAPRPRHPPFVARRTMPALRVDGKLLPGACAPYRDGQSWPKLRFRPARPLAGAPFGVRTVALGQ